MKPNITNLKKVVAGDVKLDEIEIEINNRYMPTMHKVTLISKVDKYIMELRLNSDGIAPSALPILSRGILVYHIIDFYTNISTRTVTDNPENFIVKALELADIAEASGVIEFLSDELDDIQVLFDMLDIIDINATGLYGMIYHIILNQSFDIDIEKLGSVLTPDNIKHITEAIEELSK